jgi:hypothetical protein
VTTAPLDEPRDAPVSAPDEVGQIAAELVQRLGRTSGSASSAATAFRTACEEVGRKLSEPRLTLALVGDAGAGRRTFINALLAERVLPTNTPRRGSTITTVRHAATLDFSATSVDGRLVAQLSRKMPDRTALFEKSIAQTDREAAATESLAARLQEARQRTTTVERVSGPAAAPTATPAATRGAAALWYALWAWILRLLAWWPWTRALPRAGGSTSDEGREPPEDPRATVASLERELAGAQSVEQIAAHAQQLRLEQQKYETERLAAFLSQVREFAGTDIAERIVDYPAKYLPGGVTLLDLPCPPAVMGAPVVDHIKARVARDVDGLVVVADAGHPPGDATASLVRELGEIVPVVLVVLTKADRQAAVAPGGSSDETRARLERVRSEGCDRVAGALGVNARRAHCVVVAAEAALEAREGAALLAEHSCAALAALRERLESRGPILRALRGAMRMRSGAADLSRVLAKDEAACKRRLSLLESKKIPDPADFRVRLLSRVDGAIEKGGDDVLEAALQCLHTAIEGLRSEWKAQIASCPGRSDVDACIASITESSATRIASALEQTAELVARELHEVTETLETWAVEEIHTQYRLVRRLGAEALAPVVSELTSEDLERELLSVQPFDGAMDAFEKQRVGYGLGGVAAGAALGTLIAPGIGTAVGAVLGVFAGFLKGTDSLKQECTAKIDACLNDTETHATAQLKAKKGDLSRVIRLTLDEALEAAFVRLDDAISRLRAVEQKAMDAQRSKLEELGGTRRALDAYEARLAKIAATTPG